MYRNLYVVNSTGKTVAKSEHNYYVRKILNEDDIDPVGRTTFAVAPELIMRPKRDGLLDENKFRNEGSRIIQNWDHGDLGYRELDYDPTGSSTLDYSTTAAFSLTPNSVGATLGIELDGKKIKHTDYSSDYGFDNKVHTEWDFPGYWECDKSRCVDSYMGNVGKVDATEPDTDFVEICPTNTRTAYNGRAGTESQSHEFKPTMYELETYH
jgi:hypothetical protein